MGAFSPPGSAEENKVPESVLRMGSACIFDRENRSGRIIKVAIFLVKLSLVATIDLLADDVMVDFGLAHCKL